MKRRNFIKGAICLGCLGAATPLCKNMLNDFKYINSSDKFIYKSKADLPKTIRLEACSLCQLNCPVCTARLLEKQAPKDWLGYLKLEDFKKFVDDNNFEQIELSNNGEIFLNPELDEIIEYAHKKGIKLTANNGVNFNSVSKKTIENLVKYKFKSLTIAIDGATPETYKIYRRGGDFNKVVDNIKKINYFKEKYNSEFPKLIYQFIVFGHNEHEVGLAKKRAWELGMEIRFRKNSYDENYSPIKNKKLVEEQTGLNLSNEDELYLACRKMFNSPQIDYNGNLLGCCFIQLKNFNTNVFKEGLMAALNSPDFIYAKHMLSDFSIPAKKGVPCTSCIDYEFIKKNNIKLVSK